MMKRPWVKSFSSLFLFSFWILIQTVGVERAMADGVDAQPPKQDKFIAAGEWLHRELEIAVPKIFRNVSPADARPGAVVAAQTRSNPNYYYHWVRDAGLTMEALLDRYLSNAQKNVQNSQEQQLIRQKLIEYFEFSQYTQSVQTLSGLGEPKFNVDGSAFNEPWGRPQNDGPALRAISLIRLALILIEDGQIDLVRQRFYNPKLANGTVIKRDLEFISHHWRDPSFDLWEEVKGDHFYTRMVQRRALVEGAKLAAVLGDQGAAQWYSNQVKELEREILGFWNPSLNYFVTTKNRVGGLDYKHSQLDTAFVLGLLHGSVGDGFLPFTDPKVLATMEKIANSFASVYSINQNRQGSVMGLAIGRYPEDLYAGSRFDGGNPWVLTTLAFAEAYYKVASELKSQGYALQAKNYLEKADSFVNRVQFHAHQDGSLNEQIDRHSGFMTSVEDLTWNYGCVITTTLARQRLEPL